MFISLPRVGDSRGQEVCHTHLFYLWRRVSDTWSVLSEAQNNVPSFVTSPLVLCSLTT